MERKAKLGVYASRLFGAALAALGTGLLGSGDGFAHPRGGDSSGYGDSTAWCAGELTADVVALDQMFFYNRLGAVNTSGMIYALRGDIVDKFSGLSEAEGATLTPGNVRLRSDKRARPLVLRMSEGECLTIEFQNLLAPTRKSIEQPATRGASIHVLGMQLVDSIESGGLNVGESPSGLAMPGEWRTYKLHGERENGHLMISGGAMTGGEGDGGTIAGGLFGSINVEPVNSRFYRSQVTHDDMQLAKIGETPDGQPIIDYEAVFPSGHKFAGKPILNMVDGSGKIVYSDLNAIIAGNQPNGRWAAGTEPYNHLMTVIPERSRDEPFREFTVIFHDEIVAKQAFPLFDDPAFAFTLSPVMDAFAINYGTGGIGAEIIANRVGVGPMWDCQECKYEEFFLESWTVGDPAMIVDIPANVTRADGTFTGPKATKALYPDDPSNVHHSYLNDHVKFRNIHAGPKEHHIFHLHAHQWLLTADSDKSTYIDSQFIGPGSAYTYDITYNGSGNRNQTSGDSIFHCHFYPHFAMGMWELWRVHDVFEGGTKLDANGRPAPGSRAYPDAEIMVGTPIPALVPLMGVAMAPMPAAVHIEEGNIVIDDTSKNAGFPFFIPGVAGHRVPQAPLDLADDGGLPRHVITGGVAVGTVSPLDFSKEIVEADATEIPLDGTAAEKVAMAYHAERRHDTFLPDGTPATGNAGFKTNGLPPQPGAPWADPCIDDWGNAVGTPRTYKIANIQLDMTLNKLGWHFPQARIISLWGDVADYLSGEKAPEPFFFRARTDDCVTTYISNLTPNVYEMDDYQVRTPTDTMGQHIHLLKFDVMASDGSGNGWNYEDGTFSPDEVIERIHAINARGGLEMADGSGKKLLTPEPHPYFGTLGAQTTIQRWYVDDVLDNDGNDRTLRTIFTHDHFGPSTHQQAGLYASFVIEPKDSVWRMPDTGEIMGNRFDGGPTSWRADILTGENGEDSYREFMFQFADFQLAYAPGPLGIPGLTDVNGIPVGGTNLANPDLVINPPAREGAGLPNLFRKIDNCPWGDAGHGPGPEVEVLGPPAPCPEAISAADVGIFSVNYRTEPLALRVYDPVTQSQASGLAGDLSYAYSSDLGSKTVTVLDPVTGEPMIDPETGEVITESVKILRAIPELNVQPDFYPPLTGVEKPGDPYTPIIPVYEGDKIQIRMQVGATEEGHIASFNGTKWMWETSDNNTGYKSAQALGISEHFEFDLPALPDVERGGSDHANDYLYQLDTSSDGQWNGLWGIMRAFDKNYGKQLNLLPLPNNPVKQKPVPANKRDYAGVCPKTAPIREFNVFAKLAADILPEGTLIYNSRTGANPTHPGPLNDPTAIIYVLEEDLVPATFKKGKVNIRTLRDSGVLRSGVKINPLILRANAGDCIKVTLYNDLPEVLPYLAGYNALPMVIEGFNANDIVPSSHVGLNAQLVAYDMWSSDGFNVGINPVQTAAPGGKVKYTWYAGTVDIDEYGARSHKPMEYGIANLRSSDPIMHASKGAFGALIIEPKDSIWLEDFGDRSQATVYNLDGSVKFREFVILAQDDVNLRDGAGLPIENLAGEDDSEDTGQKAFNYKTEPMWFRMGFDPDLDFGFTNNWNFADVLTNAKVGGDPETPVFTVEAGTPVMMRYAQAGGHPRNHVFTVAGHEWQRSPYVAESSAMGDNPLSTWTGAQEGQGPAMALNAPLQNGAGGAFAVPGDYLYRDMGSFGFDGGMWGIMRVTDPR